MRIVSYVVAALVAFGGVAPLKAGAQEAEPQGSWTIGGSVGLPGYGSETDFDLFVVGVQFSQLRPQSLGADISIGTMPRALLYGLVAIGIRVGGVLPLSISDRAAILPSAGFSALGAIGPGGGMVEPGLNAGVGMLVGDLSANALRAGVTWHRFSDAGGAIWLLEIGFASRRSR